VQARCIRCLGKIVLPVCVRVSAVPRVYLWLSMVQLCLLLVTCRRYANCRALRLLSYLNVRRPCTSHRSFLVPHVGLREVAMRTCNVPPVALDLKRGLCCFHATNKFIFFFELILVEPFSASSPRSPVHFIHIVSLWILYVPTLIRFLSQRAPLVVYQE